MIPCTSLLYRTTADCTMSTMHVCFGNTNKQRPWYVTRNPLYYLKYFTFSQYCPFVAYPTMSDVCTSPCHISMYLWPQPVEGKLITPQQRFNSHSIRQSPPECPLTQLAVALPALSPSDSTPVIYKQYNSERARCRIQSTTGRSL